MKQIFPERHNLKQDEIEHPRLLQWQRTDYKQSALIIQEGQKKPYAAEDGNTPNSSQ